MIVPGLRYNSPVFPETLDRLFDALELNTNDWVLDAGCGRGEMLATLLERFPCRGVGVDLKAHEIRDAAVRTREYPDRVRFIVGDVREAPLPKEPLGMFVCAGATHAFGPPGETLESTLAWALPRVRTAGWLLVGEGFWQQDPPAAYLAATGMSPDEHGSLDETLDLARASGARLDQAVVSSPAEWDHFESQFWATAEAQLAEDPSDPERQRTAAHWANWKRAYKEWGRDTLGFVFLLLQKP